MNIMVMTLGPMQTNGYIVQTDAGNAVMIDPAYGAEQIKEILQKHNLTLKKILLTHGHFDHIGAVAPLVREYNATLYVHEDDVELIENPNKSLASAMPYFPFESLQADVLLHDGDTIEQDELTFRVMHTPGHTRGSVCYFVEHIMFAGDTLFAGEIGRNDCYSGDSVAQRDTLRRIAAIEEDYHVLCGHGEATKLSTEQKNNHYLQADYYDTNL